MSADRAMPAAFYEEKIRLLEAERQQAIDALREERELVVVYRAAAQLARRQETTLTQIRDICADEAIFCTERIRQIAALLSHGEQP